MSKHRMRCLTVMLALGQLVACEDEKTISARARAIRVTNQAKTEIAAKNYSAALDLCLRAEKIDDTYDEAKYCVVAANVGAMAKAVGDVLKLVATQLAPGGYRPQSIAVKPIAASILSDIEAQIRYIDLYSYKLATMENPKFHIEDFPLNFDPTELLKAGGVDQIKVTGPLSMNLRGTWDMSEVIALAAALNGVQGVLDYALAHSLIVDNAKVAFETSGDVAAFIATNPQLLTGDPKDKGRLTGDDLHKGLKKDVLAALSYLVGRDADLEGVAPRNAGLIEAIRLSAAEADAEAVLQWTDKNGDGIPEQVGIPALDEFRDKILDQDGKPILEKSTFENFLSEDTWHQLIAFGKTLRDNIEKGGGAPAAVAPVLERIVGDLKPDHASIRLLQKKVPDVVALNPGAFFKAPKYINEMFPYFYQYALAATAGTYYDLAVDTENYDGADNYLTKMDLRYGLNAQDFGHFDYPDSDEFSAAFTVASYSFTAFDGKPVAIGADGVKPTEKTPRLWYVALLDPTFGGILLGDPAFTGDATGGNYVALDNLEASKLFNKLLKYYCLDTTSLDLDIVNDDAAIYADNKIAACDQALE